MKSVMIKTLKEILNHYCALEVESHPLLRFFMRHVVHHFEIPFEGFIIRMNDGLEYFFRFLNVNM